MLYILYYSIYCKIIEIRFFFNFEVEILLHWRFYITNDEIKIASAIFSNIDCRFLDYRYNKIFCFLVVR